MGEQGWRDPHTEALIAEEEKAFREKVRKEVLTEAQEYLRKVAIEYADGEVVAWFSSACNEIEKLKHRQSDK